DPACQVLKRVVPAHNDEVSVGLALGRLLVGQDRIEVRLDYSVIGYLAVTDEFPHWVKFYSKGKTAIAYAGEIVEGVFGDAPPDVHVERKHNFDFRFRTTQNVGRSLQLTSPDVVNSVIG